MILKKITHHNLQNKVEFFTKTTSVQELGEKAVWTSWGRLWGYIEYGKKSRKNKDGIIEYYEVVYIVIRYKSRISVDNEIQAQLPDGRRCKVVDWGNLDKTDMRKDWTLITAITND